jgi:hypothetical protein
MLFQIKTEKHEQLWGFTGTLNFSRKADKAR